jgi:hypothetical protein
MSYDTRVTWAVKSVAMYLWALAVIVLACLRLCHVHWLWADEDYHLAAAIRILHSQIPYRDFWYDKPPLAAFYYVLIGGFSGWTLRLLDSAYILLGCFLIYRLSGSRLAAFLLAFFTAFYLPAAVIPFAPDALLLVPHLAAVYFAFRRRAFWAGIFCGIGLLINLKAVFILPVCALWLLTELPLLAAGFALPLLASALTLILTGAWTGFYEQVWQWGVLYAHGAPVPHPIQLGLTRILNWLGFHSALLLGATLFFLRAQKDRLRFAAWIVLSFVAVCLGNHFAPRYFLQVLPPLAVVAARGFTKHLLLAPTVDTQPEALAPHDRTGIQLRSLTLPALFRDLRLCGITLAILLLIPLIRFGPRYAIVAMGRDPNWPDVALDRDSQQAAAIIQKSALPGDTLFVWGYRPDIYVYARRLSDSRFWDSQPLTGVPADRHLTESQNILGPSAALHRAEFVQSGPTFFVDGLGLLNPALAPRNFPEIRQWMLQYKLVARTRLCSIYHKINPE